MLDCKAKTLEVIKINEDSVAFVTNNRPIKIAIYENDKLLKEINHYYTNKSKRLFINQEEKIRGIIRDSAFPYAFQYHNDFKLQRNVPFVKINDTIIWCASSRKMDDYRYQMRVLYRRILVQDTCRVHNYEGENSLWKVYDDSVYEQIDTLTSFRTDSIIQNNRFSYLIDTNLFKNRRLTDPKQLYYHPKRKTLFALCDNNYNDDSMEYDSENIRYYYPPEIIEYDINTKQIIQKIILPEKQKRIFIQSNSGSHSDEVFDLAIGNFVIYDSLLYVCYRNKKLDSLAIFNLNTKKWDSFISISHLDIGNFKFYLDLKFYLPNVPDPSNLSYLKHSIRFKVFVSENGKVFFSDYIGNIFSYNQNKFDTLLINKYNIEKDSGYFPYYHQKNFFADGFENIYLSSNIDGKLYKFNPKSKKLDILIDSFVFHNKLQRDYSPMDYTFDCDANLLGYFYKTKWYKDSLYYFYNLRDSDIRATHYKYFSEINTRFKFVKNSLKNYRFVAYFIDGDSVETSEIKNEIASSLFTENHIYPNPFTNELKLDLESFEKDIILELFDLQGRKVISQRFQNKKSITLKTDEVSKGNYILKLKTKTYEKDYKVQKE